MYDIDSIFNYGVRSVIEAQLIYVLQSVEIPPFVIYVIVIFNSTLPVLLFLVLFIALLCRPLSFVVDHHDADGHLGFVSN